VRRNDVRRLVAGVAIALVLGVIGPAISQEKQAGEVKKSDDMKSTTGAQSAKVRRVDGIVKSVEPNGFVVSGKEHKKERDWAFAITDTTMKRGEKELKAGDAVTVEYVEQDGKVIAQSVTVKDGRTSRPAEASGATKK
jgi:hypothetical protein